MKANSLVEMLDFSTLSTYTFWSQLFVVGLSLSWSLLAFIVDQENDNAYSVS